MGERRVGNAVGSPRTVVIHLWDTSYRNSKYDNVNGRGMLSTSRIVCNDALSVVLQRRTSYTTSPPFPVGGLCPHSHESRGHFVSGSGPIPSGPGQLYKPCHSTTKYKAHSH